MIINNKNDLVKLNCPDMRKDFGNIISDTTINNYIRNMKVFFNYCLEGKYIKSTPMENVKFLFLMRVSTSFKFA